MNTKPLVVVCNYDNNVTKYKVIVMDDTKEIIHESIFNTEHEAKVQCGILHLRYWAEKHEPV